MSTTQPIRTVEKLHKFEDYYRSVQPNARNYSLIILGLNSALRISDILQLTYGDVYDYARGEWRRHITVKEKKTGKTNRVYINTGIKNALAIGGSCAVHRAEDWLFPSQMRNETPLSRYQAYRLIKRAAEYAGLDNGVSCHSMRKTFGYHAWKQGTPPALLMDIYNHSSFQVTKRYLGIEQDDRDEVFEKIKL